MRQSLLWANWHEPLTPTRSFGESQPPQRTWVCASRRVRICLTRGGVNGLTRWSVLLVCLAFSKGITPNTSILLGPYRRPRHICHYTRQTYLAVNPESVQNFLY